MTKAIIGVDVSKEACDFYDLRTGREARLRAGRVPSWSKADGPQEAPVLVFESTGVYGKRFAHAVREQGLRYAEVNPRQVRRYAQACGILAKNDRLDARVIARYAEACGVRESESVPQQERLRVLVTRREQVLALQQAEQGHLESCDDAIIRADIAANIAFLKKQMQTMDALLKTALKAEPRTALLLSMPGMGETATASLLAHMPEIGTLSRAEAAALAGLAPHVRDSGTFKGRRAIYGGRAPVRRALYMPALVAIRHNPACKTKYEALRRRGKPFKVAITAVMRYMIVTLNAMCKNNALWNA